MVVLLMSFLDKIMTVTKSIDEVNRQDQLIDYDTEANEENTDKRPEYMKEIIADSLSKITPKGFYIGVHSDNSAFVYDKHGNPRYYEDHNVKKITDKEDGETIFQVTDKSNVDLLVDLYGENEAELLLNTPQPVITTHERHVVYQEKVVEKIKEVKVPVEVEKIVYKEVETEATSTDPVTESPQFTAIKEEMTTNNHYSFDLSSGEITLQKIYDAIELLEYKVSKVEKSEDNRIFDVMYDYNSRVMMANPILYDQYVLVSVKIRSNIHSDIERIFKIKQDYRTHELLLYPIQEYIDSLDEYIESVRDLSFYTLYNGTLYKNNVLEVKGGSSTLNMLF